VSSIEREQKLFHSELFDRLEDSIKYTVDHARFKDPNEWEGFEEAGDSIFQVGHEGIHFYCSRVDPFCMGIVYSFWIEVTSYDDSVCISVFKKGENASFGEYEWT